MSARRTWNDDTPVTRYSVAENHKPTNSLVILAAGSGNDPAALAAATKKLRRTLNDNGTWTLMRRDSELWAFYSRGTRRKRKSARARARIKKSLQRRALAEARRDPDGRRARRPSAPREVMVAA